MDERLVSGKHLSDANNRYGVESWPSGVRLA